MNAKFIKFAGVGATPGSLADNIRAYWKFDELTGTTAYDATGHGFHGTMYGSPTLGAPSKLYYSISCDGTDDYVDCGTVVGDVGWSNFTVAGWIYLNGILGVSNGICGCWGTEPNYYIRVGTSNTLGARFRPYLGVDITVSSDVALSAGVWYYFAAVYNRGGYLSLYINGVEQIEKVDISPYSGTEMVNNNSFNIAQIGSNLAGYYGNIRVEGLGIWLENLSGTKISQLYNSGYGLDYPFI